MKFLVVLSVALACVAADISEYLKNEGAAPIIGQEYDVNPDGTFKYSFQTANGIAAQVDGNLENTETGPSEVLIGAYKFIAPDGSAHETSYVADKEGYKPVSADIPVGPAIPEGIIRGLAYIAAHPPQPARP